MGVEDGSCAYNFRMLFPLKIPCAFPRMRIAAIDEQTFSSDEAIGEVNILFNFFSLLSNLIMF